MDAPSEQTTGENRKSPRKMTREDKKANMAAKLGKGMKSADGEAMSLPGLRAGVAGPKSILSTLAESQVDKVNAGNAGKVTFWLPLSPHAASRSS